MPEKITVELPGSQYYLERCRLAEARCRGAWVELLTEYPEYGNECPYWADFTSEEWVELLIRHPEWQDRCNMSDFSPADWWWLLLNRSCFIEQCDCWEDFNANQRQSLLHRHPQIAQRRSE